LKIHAFIYYFKLERKMGHSFPVLMAVGLGSMMGGGMAAKKTAELAGASQKNSNRASILGTWGGLAAASIAMGDPITAGAFASFGGVCSILATIQGLSKG
jgi:hypothetical protein